MFIDACSAPYCLLPLVRVTVIIPLKLHHRVIYSVSFSAEEGGTVDNLGGDFEEGTQLTVTATADEGFLFTQWSDGSVENPRENNGRFLSVTDCRILICVKLEFTGAYNAKRTFGFTVQVLLWHLG